MRKGSRGKDPENKIKFRLQDPLNVDFFTLENKCQNLDFSVVKSQVCFRPGLIEKSSNYSLITHSGWASNTAKHSTTSTLRWEVRTEGVLAADCA